MIALLLTLVFILSYAQLAYFLKDQSISANRSRQTMMVENQICSLHNLFVEVQYWDKAIRHQIQPGAEKQFEDLLNQMRRRIDDLIADSQNAAFGKSLQEIRVLLAEYESDVNRIIQLRTNQQLQTGEEEILEITARFLKISNQLKIILQQATNDADAKMKSDFEETETSRNRMHSFFLYSTSLGFLILMLIISVISRKIVYPIRAIAGVMRNVKSGQIQDRFVFAGSPNDEIVQLGHSFNSMLDTLSENNQRLIAVQQDLESKIDELAVREAELEKHRNRLEELVADRTAELQFVINQLQEEIFQRERIQGELKHAKEEAENANQAKSEFLANMSHEIRTPLNGVIGFTAMLMETTLDDKQQDYADIIKRSSEALSYLINDILDFSKIEAGDLEFERIEFDPEQIAFDVCEMVGPRIEMKPVEILCRIDHDLPEKLIGDPLRFQQVLTNLMGNATKFTDSGEIELSLFLEKKEDFRIKLHVTVRDTGIGIDRNKLARIFLPFHQADGSTTRRFGGTGLGLSICRKIAQLMDGNTWAESDPGKGTAFHFTAWFQIPETMSVQTFTPIPNPPKRVLIIEDNTTSRDILVDFLNRLNLQTTVIENAIDLMSAFQATRRENMPFDLIIVNIRTQGMNGIQLSEMIRNAQTGYPPIPMVAVSSRMEPDAEACFNAGFDEFLAKPIRREKLYQTTLRLLGQPPDIRIKGDSPVESLPVDASLCQDGETPVRILLAEDNVVNQKLAVAMLTRAGYSVQIAGNGQEAVNMYIARPEDFDLIFMDVQMPIMDGIEATQHIRRQGFKNTPIIAMTAHALKGDREKCLDAGMNDYMSKPIKRDLVLEILNKWVFC